MVITSIQKKIVLIRRIIRQRRALRIVRSHCGEVYISGRKSSPTQLSKNTILHKNPSFNGLVIKGNGLVSIGDNFHSGEGCLIITQNHNYDCGSEIPYDSTYVYKNVTIEDNVWMGDRVIVLGGVTLGEGCIIQAGSVVVKDVPPCSIVGGAPAMVFKHRDIEHYNELKQKAAFH